MKLLNKSLFWLSASVFIIIGVWSLVFYFNLLAEIKESVDEKLDNYKRQIIYQAEKDSSLLLKSSFNESFFVIREIDFNKAISHKDRYKDTLMYMQDADDTVLELEPVRMLSTAFQTKDNSYELQIINSMVEEDDLLEELLRDVIALYLILIASIIIINNVVLRRLWKPFYSILIQLKNYRIGYSKSFPEAFTDTKEFMDLQNAVNILLKHNTETYNQQKQFIENASHELQTPLAIVTNKLELLIEKGNFQNHQAEDISEIMIIIDRLTRLNKSLLLLTKIENKQFLDNKTVSFNEVVHQIIGDLEEIAAFKNVIISVSGKSGLTVEMDISLAHILISNLLRNAIFHNVSNGRVEIELSDNGIQLKNTGSNVPLDSGKIFSRFYKQDKVQNNTGLGLAIVKAICDLYGFTITYRNGQDMHCFEIHVR